MKKQVLVALVTATLTASAWADSNVFRVTGGLGYGFHADSSVSDVEKSLLDKGYNVPVSNFEEGGLGYSAWLGWQAHQHVLLEVGYLDFAERSAKAPNVDPGFGKALVESLPTSGQGFALALRPTFDIAKDWSVYGRLGAMRWDSNLDVKGYSSSKSGTDLLLGGGIEYRFARSWFTSLGWDSVKMDDTQNHIIVLSVTYQLGGASKEAQLQGE